MSELERLLRSIQGVRWGRALAAGSADPNYVEWEAPADVFVVAVSADEVANTMEFSIKGSVHSKVMVTATKALFRVGPIFVGSGQVVRMDADYSAGKQPRLDVAYIHADEIVHFYPFGLPGHTYG